VQLQRLYQYIFYRQLDRLAAYGTGTLAAYAACGVITICLLAVRRGLPDAIRRWSEQIEYSPDNVTLLLEIA
jgi:lysine-N-methylase